MHELHIKDTIPEGLLNQDLILQRWAFEKSIVL